ncbi:hypothetical protein AVEN_6090-1 [Araneus ventricosus]|uniref:Uncharacterized protein n=1 Tax=Araneus ventricosus TaxID=182803 RepID=A0A4Y2GVI1_ARAVE|nr:hypothetical protein AVEN_6090-1 [Araneus ventricosus]
MTKAQENRKVILESTPVLNKVPSPEIHVKSFTDESYLSFSEIPLSERIKMITNLKTSQCHVPNMIHTTSVTSKMTENCIPPSTKDICDKIFSESNRSNIQISSEFSAVQNIEVSKNPKILNSDSTDEYAGFASKSKPGRKSIICIEFTDSEDSFLDMLPDYNRIINKSNCTSSRKSLIVYCENRTELPHSSINFLNSSESFDEICLDDRKLSLDRPLSFCVSTSIKTTTPKLLYAVKQSASNSQKCVPSIFIGSSTPFAKSLCENAVNVSNLSTPVLSNFDASSQKFSPLIFNSSNDYSVCSP